MDFLGPFLFVFSFLVGSIPFGLLTSKIFQTPDPRKAGSGNVGFTNVLRLSGKKAGIMTLIGDFGKGWAIGFLAKSLWGGQGWGFVLVFGVVLGHIVSPFLRFRGGKGVATGLGGVLGLEPLIGGILMGTWLIIVGIFKYSSGGAIVSFACLPFLSYFLQENGEFTIMACSMTLLILLRHKENIERLIKGNEGRMCLDKS